MLIFNDFICTQNYQRGVGPEVELNFMGVITVVVMVAVYIYSSNIYQITINSYKF